MLNLKVFGSKLEVIDYVFTELMATLEEDLGKMEFEESHMYTDEDREHMKNRIHDISAVYDTLGSL